MLTRIIVTLIAVATMSVLQGCGDDPPVRPDERIDGVVRVFMHEPGRYTVLRRSSAASSIVEQQVPQLKYVADTAYVPDVPEDQPMWVSVHYGGDHLSPIAHIVFHVHSVSDIGGAGWNHGKAGHGQTVVVQ